MPLRFDQIKLLELGKERSIEFKEANLSHMLLWII